MKSIWLMCLLSLVSFETLADREVTVCGWFQERFSFQVWSAAAPSANPDNVAGQPLIEPVEFHTLDDRVLRGYRYNAHHEDGTMREPKGFVWMALGNAMIADQTILALKPFAQRGYDVYIYDYRGYGQSEGKRRINAFVEDSLELLEYLNADYSRALLYGVSMGGIVVANAIGRGGQFDRAVIDSSPSRISMYGCPIKFDPIENLPANAHNLMVITGQRDDVTPEQMTAEFRQVAKARGALVYDGENYDHPFMDRNSDIRHERLERVLDFLDLGRVSSSD
ncbi:alpha/beta hydrolase family protein [Vibrio sp. WXL210]|uniref:alpha/beta hydrolase family protein n=1 Tax=Vibrio sp. WXL210 TaxID=3450709 RepID=UPI003EC70F21